MRFSLLTVYKNAETGLFTELPKPDTNNGKIERETEKQINIELYNISADDFDAYVKKCREAGFTNEVTKTDDVFYATNKEGYDLDLFYDARKDVLSIYISAYDLGGNSNKNDVSSNVQNDVILEDPVHQEEIPTQSDNDISSDHSGGFVEGFMDGLQPGLDSFKESLDEFSDIVNEPTQSTSDEILDQFTLGYENAEFDKYNSLASGNELGGSRIYFYCTLDKTEILEASSTTSILGYVTDEDGNEWLIQLHFVPAVSKTFFDSYIEKDLVLRGVYSGYSGVKEMPVVVLDEMIVLETGENIVGMQKLLDE